MKFPFLPSEAEIEALITATRGKMMAFLRLLKETAARPIEAWRLRWCDIDFENLAVNVTPAKYGKARRLKISQETAGLLMMLPRRNDYVFSPSGCSEKFEFELKHFTRNFQQIRKLVGGLPFEACSDSFCLNSHKAALPTFE